MSYYQKNVESDSDLKRLWLVGKVGEVDLSFGQSVDITKICAKISKLPEPVPLQISATLTGGVAHVLKLQTLRLSEETEKRQDDILAALLGEKDFFSTSNSEKMDQVEEEAIFEFAEPFSNMVSHPVEPVEDVFNCYVFGIDIQMEERESQIETRAFAEPPSNTSV